MVEHGDKHRRHTVEAGDLFLPHTGKRVLGREIGHRTQRGTMGHAGSHRKHHAKAVEHGYLNHHTVCGGKLHPVTDTFTVIDYVVMRQHDALREAGRTGRILHVADIRNLYSFSHPIDFFLRDQRSPIHRFFQCKTPFHPEADSNDVAEEGKLFRTQRFAGSGMIQFRREPMDDILVVRIQTGLDHDQGMGV